MDGDLDKLSYGTYLKVRELLSLQQQKSREHDELLFIIIHQVYELWFKQILHEFTKIDSGISVRCDHVIILGLKRVRHILKVMTMQTDILETMGPLSFASFRNYLGKSSGFQSVQFREFEFLLGFKDKRFLDHEFFSDEEKGRLRLKFFSPSIWEKFTNYFIGVTKDLQVDEAEERDTGSELLSQIHRVLIYIYRNHSIYTEIAELIVDIDEGLQEWRYRHVKMVERTIGDKKSGTGGSSGIDYLKQSLFKSFCPELWEIRNYFG